MNSVAAVVVTHNRLALLKQCLNALACQNRACDVLVVDNASTDGTERWMSDYRASHPGIAYLNTSANLGGAGGFHFGMRRAVELGYDYVWVMDDDCIPSPSALERLMEADAFLGSENYGFLASQVLWTDGQECKMNRPKFCRDTARKREGIVPIEQATFVSLLFPARVIREVGLPVKEFFIWGDDIEYTRRIAVCREMPGWLVEHSQVVHAMAANIPCSLATDTPDRIDRYRYSVRNEFYFYRREGFSGVCYYLARWAKQFLLILLKAPDHRLKRCRVLLGSMVRGLFFNPSIEYLEEGTSS